MSLPSSLKSRSSWHNPKPQDSRVLDLQILRTQSRTVQLPSFRKSLQKAACLNFIPIESVKVRAQAVSWERHPQTDFFPAL